MKIYLESSSEDEFMAKLCSKVSEQIKKVMESYSNEHLFTRKEAAEFLRITTTTLSKWTDHGLIPAHTLGGRVLFKKSELLDSLERKPSLKYAQL